MSNSSAHQNTRQHPKDRFSDAIPDAVSDTRRCSRAICRLFINIKEGRDKLFRRFFGVVVRILTVLVVQSVQVFHVRPHNFVPIVRVELVPVEHLGEKRRADPAKSHVPRMVPNGHLDITPEFSIFPRPPSTQTVPP